MKVKTTILGLAVVATFAAGPAQAAFLAPGSSGSITVTSGCFAFGACAVGGLGNITDNSSMGTTLGVGSAIAGDGIIGKMNFSVGVDGNSINITSYNMDTYTGTAHGDFNTRMLDTSGATGFISDTGAMTLDLAGRTGIGQYYINTFGEQAWNIDNHYPYLTYCAPGTGGYTPFTTGSSTAVDCATGAAYVSLAGSALAGGVVGGTYAGTGTIVSAGNVGSAWGILFDGTPYSEIYNVTVTGTAAVVPVPAAAWLFGSGILGLASMARRKRRRE